MDRNWLETIRLLGLDAEFAVVLGLLALDWAAKHVRRALARSQAGKQASLGAAPLRQSASAAADEGVPFGRDQSAWPSGA
jgi:hypothetical protein